MKEAGLSAMHPSSNDLSAPTKSRREVARSTAPLICYAIENLPRKHGSETLYEELRTAVKDGKTTLVEKLEIPPCDARSWRVAAGNLFRIVCTSGPQVWNLELFL